MLGGTLQTHWSFDLGSTVGGVAVNDEYVYVIRSSSQNVRVLDKETGLQTRSFK